MSNIERWIGKKSSGTCIGNAYCNGPNGTCGKIFSPTNCPAGYRATGPPAHCSSLNHRHEMQALQLAGQVHNLLLCDLTAYKKESYHSISIHFIHSSPCLGIEWHQASTSRWYELESDSPSTLYGRTRHRRPRNISVVTVVTPMQASCMGQDHALSLHGTLGAVDHPPILKLDQVRGLRVCIFQCVSLPAGDH